MVFIVLQFATLYVTEGQILTYHGGLCKFISSHYKFVMVRNCSATYSEVRIQQSLFCGAATNTGIGNTHKPSYFVVPPQILVLATPISLLISHFLQTES